MADPEISLMPRTCNICARLRWHDLPAEDDVAYPHQPSRQALESSARSCPVCKLVLQAAISNYRDSRGIRDGKGSWRQWNRLKVQDESGIREVTLVKDLGVCRLEGEPVLNEFSSGPPIILSYLNSAMVIGEESRLWQTVIMPTRDVDMNYNCLAAEPLPEREEADIKASTAFMPVWVYGNYWCHREVYIEGMDVHLMGFGARFGHSGRPEDAVNTNPGQIHLRGSSFVLCTNDGKNLRICTCPSLLLTTGRQLIHDNTRPPARKPV